jgi:hypothetical protein
MSVSVAKYYPGKPLPKKDGYTNILIHTQETNLGGKLSPYNVKNEKGQILENIWQFSKWYPSVDKQEIHLSARYPNSRVIWNHPAETHAIKDEPTDEYWAWREKGMNNPYAVRYPAGFQNRHNCICSLWEDDNGEYDQLDYLTARKVIYCGEYIKAYKSIDDYHLLKKKLDNGENLQIIEVDGPDPTCTYYPYNKISVDNPGLKITEKRIKILLNDPRKPFGHGYVIAALLLDGEKWLE